MQQRSSNETAFPIDIRRLSNSYDSRRLHQIRKAHHLMGFFIDYVPSCLFFIALQRLFSSHHVQTLKPYDSVRL